VRAPTRSTIFPYTTLFRSVVDLVDGIGGHQDAAPFHPLQQKNALALGMAGRTDFVGGQDHGGSSRGLVRGSITSRADCTRVRPGDRKSTRLNSSHVKISYA